MLSVIGSVNVAPGAVTQSLVDQDPAWHAQELIVTTTLLRGLAGLVSMISLPNSEVCCAWKGWLGRFPGSGETVLL